MAFCTECGAVNEGGVRFCTGCGARVEPMAPPPRGFPAAIGRTAPGAMTSSEFFVLGGAGLTLLSFFLPWASSPSPSDFGGLGEFARLFGPSWRQESVSGWGLFKLAGAWVLLGPVMAVVAGVLVLGLHEASRAARLQAAGWQIFLAAPNALYGVAILFVPVVPSILSVGFYGSMLGFLGILAGSFMLLSKLARQG